MDPPNCGHGIILHYIFMTELPRPPLANAASNSLPHNLSNVVCGNRGYFGSEDSWKREKAERLEERRFGDSIRQLRNMGMSCEMRSARRNAEGILPNRLMVVHTRLDLAFRLRCFFGASRFDQVLSRRVERRFAYAVQVVRQKMAAERLERRTGTSPGSFRGRTSPDLPAKVGTKTSPKRLPEAPREKV